MANCYSADHNAEDHIHTDITCTIREPQESTALERSVIDYWWGLHMFNGSKPSLLASALVPHEGVKKGKGKGVPQPNSRRGSGG